MNPADIAHDTGHRSGPDPTETAAAALKMQQGPLKQRYRDDPTAALVTLSAEGELSGSGVACRVRTASALAEAGLHPATGGDGSQLCSGDMLLEALVACAGVTLRAVATSLRLDVGGTVHAEGDLDFRGTLGVDPDAPVGFRAIRLRFDLDTSADAAQVATLVRLTERYCVVLQTLRRTPDTAVSVTDSPAAAGSGAVPAG